MKSRTPSFWPVLNLRRCGVSHPQRVEVDEDQAAVRLAVRVAAVEVAVAGLPSQVAGRRLDPTAQQRDQLKALATGHRPPPGV
jgi:hypothetical protein